MSASKTIKTYETFNQEDIPSADTSEKENTEQNSSSSAPGELDKDFC